MPLTHHIYAIQKNDSVGIEFKEAKQEYRQSYYLNLVDLFLKNS